MTAWHRLRPNAMKINTSYKGSKRQSRELQNPNSLHWKRKCSSVPRETSHLGSGSSSASPVYQTILHVVVN